MKSSQSKPKKKPKEKKLGDYKKKAWTVFSKYIRLRDSKNGYCKCVTCEVVDEMKYLQAGHFVPGRNNSILFDERNCHAQCRGCNFYGENSKHFGKYYEFMVSEYGIEVVDELLRESNKNVIYKARDYQEKEEKYKDKIADMCVGLELSSQA